MFLQVEVAAPTYQAIPVPDAGPWRGLVDKKLLLKINETIFAKAGEVIGAAAGIPKVPFTATEEVSLSTQPLKCLDHS